MTSSTSCNLSAMLESSQKLFVRYMASDPKNSLVTQAKPFRKDLPCQQKQISHQIQQSCRVV
eukprot:3723169-Amphidinium_carterae.1